MASSTETKSHKWSSKITTLVWRPAGQDLSHKELNTGAEIRRASTGLSHQHRFQVTWTDNSHHKQPVGSAPLWVLHLDLRAFLHHKRRNLNLNLHSYYHYSSWWFCFITTLKIFQNEFLWGLLLLKIWAEMPQCSWQKQNESILGAGFFCGDEQKSQKEKVEK